MTLNLSEHLAFICSPGEQPYSTTDVGRQKILEKYNLNVTISNIANFIQERAIENDSHFLIIVLLKILIFKFHTFE